MVVKFIVGDSVRIFRPGHVSHGAVGKVVHVQSKPGLEDLVTVDAPKYCRCVVRPCMLEKIRGGQHGG